MHILTLSTVAKYLSVLRKCAKWCMQYHISNQSKSSRKVPLHCICLVLVILYGACTNTKYKSLSKVTDLLPGRGRVKKKISSDGLMGCLFRREVTFVKQISSAWYPLVWGKSSRWPLKTFLNSSGFCTMDNSVDFEYNEIFAYLNPSRLAWSNM